MPVGSRGIRKGIVSNNPKLRKMLMSISGTAGVPAAAGLDSSQVSSVVDNGVGNYTIIFKYPYHPNGEAMAMITPITPNVSVAVTAVDHDRVTVKTFTDSTGAAVDADFYMEVTGNDGKIGY